MMMMMLMQPLLHDSWGIPNDNEARMLRKKGQRTPLPSLVGTY